MTERVLRIFDVATDIVFGVVVLSVLIYAIWKILTSEFLW